MLLILSFARGMTEDGECKGFTMEGFPKQTFAFRLISLLPEDKTMEWVESIGIKHDTFAKAIRRKTIPRSDFIYKLVVNAGVNANWLLTGEGEPYLKDAPKPFCIATGSPCPVAHTGEDESGAVNG